LELGAVADSLILQRGRVSQNHLLIESTGGGEGGKLFFTKGQPQQRKGGARGNNSANVAASF